MNNILGRECKVECFAVNDDGRVIRELLTFSDLTKAGEKLAVEFSYCRNHGGKHALPVLWARKGWKDHVLPTWWSVDVYAREDGGAVYPYPGDYWHVIGSRRGAIGGNDPGEWILEDAVVICGGVY